MERALRAGFWLLCWWSRGRYPATPIRRRSSRSSWDPLLGWAGYFGARSRAGVDDALGKIGNRGRIAPARAA